MEEEQSWCRYLRLQLSQLSILLYSILKVGNQDMTHCPALDIGVDEHARLDITLTEQVSSFVMSSSFLSLESRLCITDSKNVMEEGASWFTISLIGYLNMHVLIKILYKGSGPSENKRISNHFKGTPLDLGLLMLLFIASAGSIRILRRQAENVSRGNKM